MAGPSPLNPPLSLSPRHLFSLPRDGEQMEPYPDIKHYYYPRRYYEIGSARRQHQQHFLSVDEEVSECDQAHEKD